MSTDHTSHQPEQIKVTRRDLSVQSWNTWTRRRYCGNLHTYRDVNPETGNGPWRLGEDEELVHRTYEDRPTGHYYYTRCRSCGNKSASLPKKVFWERSVYTVSVNEHIVAEVDGQ